MVPPTEEIPNVARLAAGDIAADFVLQDQDGQSVSLPQFRGRRVALLFMPAAAEVENKAILAEVQKSLPTLTAAGLGVLCVMSASVVKVAAVRDSLRLEFPLLADTEQAVSHAFGAFGTKDVGLATTLGVVRTTVTVEGSGHVASAVYEQADTDQFPDLMRLALVTAA